jgi:hypothetical protein
MDKAWPICSYMNAQCICCCTVLSVFPKFKALIHHGSFYIFLNLARWSLKVPKCENFHCTDFFYFFTIKPLWVGDFIAKMKISKF